MAAHLALLGLALTHRWAFDVPPEAPDPPWERVMTVELAPRAHAAASASARPPAILSRAPRPGEAPEPLPPQGIPTTPPAAPAAQPAPGPSPALAHAGGAGGGAGGPDLGAALRHGVLGCANLAGLSRVQREGCEEKLGAGAKHEPVLAEGRDPRIQAYYDAVAKAKAPDKPWTPIRAIGAMGVFEEVPRASNDRIGGVGCTIPFGPKPKLPSHWLKLGPCFIAPPKGPFTTEVDITPPDQDLSHPAPRAGPQRPPGVRHENAAGSPASGSPLERDTGKDAAGEKPPT